MKADISGTLITPFLILKCNRTSLGKLCMGPQSALVSRRGIAWEKTFKNIVRTCEHLFGYSQCMILSLKPDEIQAKVFSQGYKKIIGLLP